MRKQHIVRLVLGTILATPFVVSTAGAQSLDFPPISFKILSGTLGTPGDILMKNAWKDVARESGGKVVVNVQSETELGLKGPEVYRLAKSGVAEVTSTALLYSGGDIPHNDGIDIQGLVQDVETLRKVADAWLPELKKAYATTVGVELIGVFPIVAQVMWCSMPMTGLDDLKGRKVRVSGIALGKLIGSLGAVPTTISFAEVVPSLQRNIIDCAVTGTTSGNLAKWPEVATHIYPLVTGWAVQGIYGNKKWWDGLNPKARTFVANRFNDMIEEGWGRAGLETNHGIWCSTGDSRCDINVPLKPLQKYNMTFVPLKPEDKQRVLQVAEKVVTPDFAARCGRDCAEAWTNTVGKVLGVKAVAP